MGTMNAEHGVRTRVWRNGIVEDAVEHRERPKASRYATHMFLWAYEIAYDSDNGELHAGKVAAFVLKRALVTVRRRRSPASTGI